MKRAFRIFTLLLITSIVCSVAAQESNQAKTQGSGTQASDSRRGVETERDVTAEVETLKRRIDELESQNRAMLQLLGELKSKLDEPAHIANASSARPDAKDARLTQRRPSQ